MRKLGIAGLFAGIGGLELGLAQSGHKTKLLCEIDGAACAVLQSHWPSVPLQKDVRELTDLPKGVDLIAGGFPCQDLSQAGETRGITGSRSGLVNEVFRLAKRNDTPHILLENVSFMLQLHQGRAMRHIADKLENLGYSWAYRVVDSRAFGVPQRRERVFIFASKKVRPWELLFQDDSEHTEFADFSGKACGFYWTEGSRGLGWAIDAIPTLKGGSTIGIPSAPAIWMPDGRIVTPDIRDAERLQGFEADWTKAAEADHRASLRWKLIGNAVTVNASAWVGRAISKQPQPLERGVLPFDQTKSWPKAAYGAPGIERQQVAASTWPMRAECPPLASFLKHEPRLLSHRAVTGFISRLQVSGLRYPREFMAALESHRDSMEPKAALAKPA